MTALLPRELESERLLLRRWREADRAPFAVMNADARVMENFPARLSVSESDAYVERIHKHFADHGFGLWAVEVKNDAPFVGFVGLAVPRFEAHFTPCVEIGWRLDVNHRGRGYATEGAIVALRFAFRHLGRYEILAITKVAHGGSSNTARVLRKAFWTVLTTNGTGDDGTNGRMKTVA